MAFLLVPILKEKRFIYRCVINSRFHPPVGGKRPHPVFRFYFPTKDRYLYLIFVVNCGLLLHVIALKHSGRQVIVIDPFGVTQGKDFQQGKSESLLKHYTFNPFDWIPADQKQRDRMMNAFAASFVINEGGMATHFDENAKILIRGYIDYIMTAKPPEERGLPMLY